MPKCPKCGKTFDLVNAFYDADRTAHCSMLCAGKVRQCRICNKIFDPRTTKYYVVRGPRGDDIFFCSQECYAKNEESTVVDENEKKKEMETCAQCKKKIEEEFRYVSSEDGKIYCSLICAREGRFANQQNVDHPSHYNQGKIEVIDFIEDQKLGFNLGNVIKYASRAEHKNGLEDLKKAKWYIEREIARRDGSLVTTTERNHSIASLPLTRKYDKKIDGDFRCDVCSLQSRCHEIFGEKGKNCRLPSDTVYCRTT